MQAFQGWWSCIAFTWGCSYHACPGSGARWGPVASRSIPPPAPGRWRRTRGDRSSDSSFHLLWHRPDSSPGSYPNWSLPSYCKRGFRCCRLPTLRIHHRKSAGSRSENVLPRGATVPSFHTPPSFVSPDVELLHPARFGMQMTSLEASNPAYSLFHQAPLRSCERVAVLCASSSERRSQERRGNKGERRGSCPSCLVLKCPPILRAEPHYWPLHKRSVHPGWAGSPLCGEWLNESPASLKITWLGLPCTIQWD